MKYRFLSFDMGLEDCIYRLHRDDEGGESGIVYVHLQNNDIIPGDDDQRTYGPAAVANLEKIVRGDVWFGCWRTLDVFGDGTGVQWATDQWKPRSFDASRADNSVPRIRLLDLNPDRYYDWHVFAIEAGSRYDKGVTKVYPFSYQIKRLTRELNAYHHLSRRGCDLIPKLLAYVYEQSKEEIIGFICEELDGHPPSPADYDACYAALQRLHSYGVTHGDLASYNIIVTAEGPKFIDLEYARLDIDFQTEGEEFSRLQLQECDELLRRLQGEEGSDRSWSNRSD